MRPPDGSCHEKRAALPAGACLLAGLISLAGCSAGPVGAGASRQVTIVLNQPTAKLPFVSRFSYQGAVLAAEEINRAGGVKVAGAAYQIRLEQMDNDRSPATSLENVRRAIAAKAVAVIDDGYTAEATYGAAAAAGVPLLVDYDGSTGLIDPTARPGVFRIAPPDDALAARLAGYVAGRERSVALVGDDSDYGRDGRAQLSSALTKLGVTPAASLELPSQSTDFSAQALSVQRGGATGVAIWAQAPVLAAFLRALRQAGSDARVYAGPTAEDPVVRDQLADRPDWVEGLTYASFRITTESGPDAWDRFRQSYERHAFNGGGPDYKVGVRTHDHRDVVQPPDWQIFPYDMVRLVAAALARAGTVDPGGGRIVAALDQVRVVSANGDSRGWTRDNHEGVVDDDIYFATFQDMRFKPVQDDPLSRSLPPIDQV
jgi:ABC-type branched-subunit amino acid transport system substrate-binding protein